MEIKGTMDQEEKVLRDTLIWQNQVGPDKARKNKAQVFSASAIVLVVGFALLYFDAPSITQLFGLLLTWVGMIFLWYGYFISLSSSYTEITNKYVDYDAIKARLDEIESAKGSQRKNQEWPDS